MKIIKGNNDKEIAILGNDEYISKWVEETGNLAHDFNMLPLVLPYIKQGDTVIDVGAFIGDHTIAYSRAVGEDGEVIAFEPNPEAFECLEYNLRCCPNAILRKECLGDSHGKMTLIMHPQNAGMAYIESKKGKSKSITIDSLELERLDFIKIDAEGFEHRILKGAEKTIKKFKPVMLIEINNHALNRNETSDNDIYIYLIELGYDYRNIYPGQPIHAPQLDLLCTPK